ncbi:hypothetical protein K443DRAFT_4841 [Laccaria amethystina LaAM-08-1]|uniref:Uncharacterized protein n=1 Tax=Laccaria amethystina LaAM-08-1 TaxID=1095629 RepID=A0A0C9Y288_9AGAR|nr:hypothetical protein K443DRAFT_4841 [Laccaria amethystina LaAM-08-1]
MPDTVETPIPTIMTAVLTSDESRPSITLNRSSTPYPTASSIMLKVILLPLPLILNCVHTKTGLQMIVKPGPLLPEASTPVNESTSKSKAAALLQPKQPGPP